jgi:hypothetical protein
MKLSIPSPCPEKWESMTPNKEGAFCGSCARNVIDFTSKTAPEIKKFFSSKPAEERVCGRFNSEQLVEVSFEDFYSRFRFWNFTKKCAAIILFAFSSIFFISCGPTTGEIIEPKDMGRMDSIHEADSIAAAMAAEELASDTMAFINGNKVVNGKDTPGKN